MKRWVMTLCVRADQATRALERIADAVERIANALETPESETVRAVREYHNGLEKLPPGVQDPRD